MTDPSSSPVYSRSAKGWNRRQTRQEAEEATQMFHPLDAFLPSSPSLHAFFHLLPISITIPRHYSSSSSVVPSFPPFPPRRTSSFTSSSSHLFSYFISRRSP